MALRLDNLLPTAVTLVTLYTLRTTPHWIIINKKRTENGVDQGRCLHALLWMAHHLWHEWIKHSESDVVQKTANPMQLLPGMLCLFWHHSYQSSSGNHKSQILSLCIYFSWCYVVSHIDKARERFVLALQCVENHLIPKSTEQTFRITLSTLSISES